MRLNGTLQIHSDPPRESRGRFETPQTPVPFLLGLCAKECRRRGDRNWRIDYTPAGTLFPTRFWLVSKRGLISQGKLPLPSQQTVGRGRGWFVNLDTGEIRDANR